VLGVAGLTMAMAEGQKLEMEMNTLKVSDLDDLPDPYWSHSEISSLKNIPRQDEAKELIHRAANAVTPLLQRRKWRIIHLTEFYPKNPSLHGLNINHGSMIKIRLRTPERFVEKSFFFTSVCALIPLSLSLSVSLSVCLSLSLSVSLSSQSVGIPSHRLYHRDINS
jgi:hypothetical protein